MGLLYPSYLFRDEIFPCWYLRAPPRENSKSVRDPKLCICPWGEGMGCGLASAVTHREKEKQYPRPAAGQKGLELCQEALTRPGALGCSSPSGYPVSSTRPQEVKSLYKGGLAKCAAVARQLEHPLPLPRGLTGACPCAHPEANLGVQVEP